MSEIASIVVVGAGQAGASAIETLRAQGYRGRLSLVGDEPILPYQRPPLSKKYLLGEISMDNLAIRPKNYYEQNNVELHTDVRVEGIDAADQSMRLSNGTELAWDRLLLATGAVPRNLPMGLTNGFDAIHTIRTVGDVDNLALHFADSNRVLIVGGGYIGLEAAAIARQRGLDTTVIEAAPRILQRVAAEDTSHFIAGLHRRNGVDLRESVSIESLRPKTDGGCLVKLTDTSQLEVNFVIAESASIRQRSWRNRWVWMSTTGSSSTSSAGRQIR